jgi:ABC-2 type transport system ATP-binding protein
MAAIEVDGIRKLYGGRPAVDGVTFDVEAGEIFCILGPNGAGKTTTIEIVEGYRRPDEGSVRVLGMQPGASALKSRIGVMLQDGGLYPGAEPLELLRLFAAFYPNPRDPRELLDLVGLAEAASTPIRRLSGGQRQRVSLAAALVADPDVLFLDEPTAGMDPSMRAQTVEMLAGLDTTIVLTTHLLDEAERLAGRIAVVDRGRVVASGTPSELTAGDAREVSFEASPGLDVGALGHAAGADVIVEERPGRYRARMDATPGAVARLTAALAERDVLVRELRVGRRTLEDVYLELTRSR